MAVSSMYFGGVYYLFNKFYRQSVRKEIVMARALLKRFGVLYIALLANHVYAVIRPTSQMKDEGSFLDVETVWN